MKGILLLRFEWLARLLSLKIWSLRSASIKKKYIGLSWSFCTATWPVYCQFLKCNPCINHVFNILKPLTLVLPGLPPPSCPLLPLSLVGHFIAACLRLFSMPFHYRLLMYVLSFAHLPTISWYSLPLFSRSLFLGFFNWHFRLGLGTSCELRPWLIYFFGKCFLSFCHLPRPHSSCCPLLPASCGDTLNEIQLIA